MKNEDTNWIIWGVIGLGVLVVLALATGVFSAKDPAMDDTNINGTASSTNEISSTTPQASSTNPTTEATSSDSN